MDKIYLKIITFCGALLATGLLQAQTGGMPTDTCTAETTHTQYMLQSRASALKLLRPGQGTEPQYEDKQQITAYASQGGKVSVSVNGLEDKEIRITVYNIIGNLVFVATFTKVSAEPININLDKHFQPGIYVVTGTSGTKLIRQQKVMIN